MKLFNITYIIIILLPISLFCQNDQIVMGTSLDKFIMKPHHDVSIAYGNLANLNSNYIVTPKYLLGLNNCGTEIVLINKFDGLTMDIYNLNNLGFSKFKQLRNMGCKYNYLVNSPYLAIKHIEKDVFIFGIVKKSEQYFYLKIEVIKNKLQQSIVPIFASSSVPEITNKEIDKKRFPECFLTVSSCHYFSYDKGFFYYNGDPLARCISNKKNKNDSLVQYYFKTNVLYHNNNNQLKKIKSYFKKGLKYGIAEDTEYMYFHNREDILVLDKNGNILLEDKLSSFFKEKSITLKSKGYGKNGIYAIVGKNYRFNYESKLTTDTLITDIYKLVYDSVQKKIITKKQHTIFSNYPIYCKQIEGSNYYFQYSFIGKNENLYKLNLDRDTINIITNYPKKTIELLNNKKSKLNTHEENKTDQEHITNYLKNVEFSTYSEEYTFNKKNRRYKNNTEVQLIKSILEMLEDTAEFDNLFMNYVVYEKQSKALKSDSDFKKLVVKLKTDEYLFLIEELKEHLNILLKKSNIIAEYKNIKAYGNKAINKNGIRFYPIIKLEDKFYIHLSSPRLKSHD